MPTLLRAQVTLAHVSGLPRDNATNTFWVFTDEAGDDVANAQAVAAAVRDFYITDPPGTGTVLMNFLSRAIKDTGHSVKISPIDMETGADTRGLGFPPVWTEAFNLPGRAAHAAALPAEVALCLSFKNTQAGAVPPARRRGRAYFGPIGFNGLASGEDISRPTDALQESLLQAGQKLEADIAATANILGIYSRPYAGRDEVPRPGNPRGPLPALPARDGSFFSIQEWWVDNRFDTIRKRGERPTARITGT